MRVKRNVSEKIATLDIEASDIHPESYPIEVGILMPNGDSYCSLIKPPADWLHWSAEAEAIHGISREELIENGRPVDEVAYTLNGFLKNKTIYSDCWVLDHPWMIRLFQAASLEPAFIVSDIMYRLSEDEYDELGVIKRSIESQLNIERHRATNDARILQLAYDHIMTHRHLPVD